MGQIKVRLMSDETKKQSSISEQKSFDVWTVIYCTLLVGMEYFSRV